MTDKTTTKAPDTRSDIIKALGLGAIYSKIEEMRNIMENVMSLLTRNGYESQATELGYVNDKLIGVASEITHEIYSLENKKE